MKKPDPSNPEPKSPKPSKYSVPQKHLDLSQVDNTGKLPVTKLDAAERQLEGAITMWFSDGDPVCICTLVHAAHEVLRTLNAHKNTGRKSLADGAGVIREEYLEAYSKLFSRERNFLKHADRDPDETLFLTVENLPFVILDATALHAALEVPQRPAIQAFKTWMWLSMPEIYFDKSTEQIPQLKRQSALRSGKATFFNAAMQGFGRGAIPLKRL